MKTGTATSSEVPTSGRGRAQPGSRASLRLATATRASPRGNAISVATEPMNVADAATHCGTRSVIPSSSTTAAKNQKTTDSPATAREEPARAKASGLPIRRLRATPRMPASSTMSMATTIGKGPSRRLS